MTITTYTMAHDSTEYRRILVEATDDNSAVINPTGYDVDIAFVAVGAQPVLADWNPATWVTVGSTYYAKILVGPDGGLTLADTDYHVYVRVDAGMEYPYLLAGRLVFI